MVNILFLGLATIRCGFGMHQQAGFSRSSMDIPVRSDQSHFPLTVNGSFLGLTIVRSGFGMHGQVTLSLFSRNTPATSTRSHFPQTVIGSFLALMTDPCESGIYHRHPAI